MNNEDELKTALMIVTLVLKSSLAAVELTDALARFQDLHVFL